MRYVYPFLPGRVEAGDARLLGNKGARLAEMCGWGLPVPPGLTITTEAHAALRREGALPASLRGEVEAGLAELGRELGLDFGDAARPLLVSVRSGAPVSMPGMMQTVSNVGLTRATLRGLVRLTSDERFAHDTFQRLTEMYARAVGEPFADDAWGQLWESINAVFRSWDSPHARAYRERARVPHDLGTAVTVQAMVFGNMGEASGAGVLFSRDPVTGARAVAGEWLPRAQGEDVVGGAVTPYPLSTSARGYADAGSRSLEESLPEVFERLKGIARLLEERYREAQEIEFVVQEGRVWVLQTRGCELGRAALARASVEMAREGLINIEEALERTANVSPDEATWELERHAQAEPFARGLPASVGVASGVLALTADRAEELAGEGKDVVLVADAVAPEDIHGIAAARALVTNTGGVASHLAVTARGWDKVCVVGCGTLEVDAAGGRLRAGGVELKESDEVTVDGGEGAVYAGRLARRKSNEFGEYFAALREWREG